MSAQSLLNFQPILTMLFNSFLQADIKLILIFINNNCLSRLNGLLHYSVLGWLTILHNNVFRWITILYYDVFRWLISLHYNFIVHENCWFNVLLLDGFLIKDYGSRCACVEHLNKYLIYGYFLLVCGLLFCLFLKLVELSYSSIMISPDLQQNFFMFSVFYWQNYSFFSYPCFLLPNKFFLNLRLVLFLLRRNTLIP